MSKPKVQGQSPRRRSLVPLIAVVSVVAGFWFGGDLRIEISIWAIAAMAVLVLLGDLLGSSPQWHMRALSAVFIGVLFLAGWYLADREIDRAFAQCVERGEEVREVLELHRKVRGSYPDSLNELAGIKLPGGRVLRPGLLSYERTAEGYELVFADRVASASATHELGFFERRSGER